MGTYEPEDMPIDPFDEGEVEDILKPEADPSVVAFLDQEEAAFQQEREAFMHLYGFDHDCHCSTDYTEGKVESVTECFINLTGQAMNRSAQATAEIRYLSVLLDRLLAMNNDLVGMLEQFGHEKELEEYFTADDDPEEFEQLDLDALEDVEATEVADEPIEDDLETG